MTDYWGYVCEDGNYYYDCTVDHFDMLLPNGKRMSCEEDPEEEYVNLSCSFKFEGKW